MIRYTQKYIKSLLDKYMDGTTTLEEEDTLARYFRGKDVPQEWEDYRQLFQEIEAMKPKANKRWIGWSVAAAILAGILYLAIPSSPTKQAQPLVAEADTTVIQQSAKTPTELKPDTMPKSVDQTQPTQTEKRRLRKQAPTINDYAKTYALMAKAEQEQREAEQQIAKCQREITEAQLKALGYAPVAQEDGTIIYINEQKEYLAYEE